MSVKKMIFRHLNNLRDGCREVESRGVRHHCLIRQNAAHSYESQNYT